MSVVACTFGGWWLDGVELHAGVQACMAGHWFYREPRENRVTEL